VHPAQVPTCLALMGDTVDNIPGARIGEKGAKDLLAKFASVEEALARGRGRAQDASGEPAEQRRAHSDEQSAWRDRHRRTNRIHHRSGEGAGADPALLKPSIRDGVLQFSKG